METRFPVYTDEFLPDTDFHHGKVPFRKGVINHQIVRANRENPKAPGGDGTSSTYKHAPDMAYFNGKYYIQYLCTPVDEHAGAGFSVLCEAEDGLAFGNFRKSFEEYKIPACSLKDCDGREYNFDGSQYAVMHQRCSFYRSSKNRMLLLGFYGYSPEKWMTPWDRNGIGRVVREIKQDGSLSEVYFIKICLNGGWTEELLKYPFYTKSSDPGFVEACDELLCNPLKMQEWAEENGDDDPMIPVKHLPGEKLQAFNYYHIDEKTVVGLWKNSRVAVSCDNGQSFCEPIKSPSLVMSGQKVWGQKLTESSYAMVYVPNLESVRRWPLCITSSRDGFDFSNMQLVHGEVPPMRYKGFWKDEGPQYVRGISEDSYRFPNDSPDADYMFLTYSVNKEDIWVSKVPVFETEALNIYEPTFSKVEDREKAVEFSDSNPTDYLKLVKVYDSRKEFHCIFFFLLEAGAEKPVYISLNNKRHETAVRLCFAPGGKIYLRTTAEICIGEFNNQRSSSFEIAFDCDCETYTAEVRVKAVKSTEREERSEKTVFDASDSLCFETDRKIRFMRAVREISELEFRTGEYRSTADPMHDPEKNEDMKTANAGTPFRPTAGKIEFI